MAVCTAVIGVTLLISATSAGADPKPEYKHGSEDPGVNYAKMTKDQRWQAARKHRDGGGLRGSSIICEDPEGTVSVIIVTRKDAKGELVVPGDLKCVRSER